MEENIVIAYLTGIIVLFILVKVFIVPIKWLCRLLINSILGVIFIWIINVTCASVNFYIGLNIYTALFIGILGVPGALALIAIKLII